MSSDEEFMNIINSNNLEEYMEESQSANDLSVKDLHIGIGHLAEAIVFITDFINAFFVAMANQEDEIPAIPVDAAVVIKNLFANAEDYCDIMFRELNPDSDDLEDLFEDEDGDDD